MSTPHTWRSVGTSRDSLAYTCFEQISRSYLGRIHEYQRGQKLDRRLRTICCLSLRKGTASRSLPRLPKSRAKKRVPKQIQVFVKANHFAIQGHLTATPSPGEARGWSSRARGYAVRVHADWLQDDRVRVLADSCVVAVM